MRWKKSSVHTPQYACIHGYITSALSQELYMIDLRESNSPKALIRKGCFNPIFVHEAVLQETKSERALLIRDS